MKVLSLFSGIGAFEKALDVLKMPYELVGYCEIDKYASKSYSAIHDVPETMNLGDITKIDEKALPKDIDLITYGFPCQDISLAGKQKGLFNEDGSQTRSGLFFEALRLIEEAQPKVAIAENVKNLVGKKFNAQFQVVLASLEAAGYNNYWKVLNAKDYGIPQNRERVFIVSIRKDIDTGTFEFPKPFPLELRLKDMLDDEVDEKFYLSDEQIDKLHINSSAALVYDKSMLGFEGSAREYNEVMPTITSREWKEPRVVNESRLNEINMVGMLDIKGNEQVRRVYGTDGISPTLSTMQGGNRQPKVLLEPTIQKVCDIPKEVLNDNERQRRVYSPEGISPTLLNRSDSPKTIVEPKIEVVGNYSPSGHDASRIVSPDGLAPTVKENHGTVTAVVEPKISVVGKINSSQDGIVVDPNGIAPTHTAGHGNTPKVLVEPAIENKPVLVGGVGEINYGKQYRQGNRIYDSQAVGMALTASPVGNAGGNSYLYQLGNLRIRKLTPKECFRLMGFTDEDFAKAEAVNSNTQLYKQAGNSIVVDVIAHIFTQLKEINEGV